MSGRVGQPKGGQRRPDGPLRRGPLNVEQGRLAAASLLALVAAIDAGEVDADEAERAYLLGAADTARRLAGAGSPDG